MERKYAPSMDYQSVRGIAFYPHYDGKDIRYAK